MKILEKNENKFIIEMLRNYLANEGISAEVKTEWQSNRAHGPYMLLVEDEQYDAAVEALAKRDPSETDDGIELTDRHGRTAAQIRERHANIMRWVARICVLAVIAYFIYLVVKYH